MNAGKTYIHTSIHARVIYSHDGLPLTPALVHEYRLFRPARGRFRQVGRELLDVGARGPALDALGILIGDEPAQG